MPEIKTYATHFASIGGACWGLEQAGLECVSAIEYMAERVECRKRNLGHEALCMDIREYQPRPQDAADLLWTSPPCTMLSSASREYADPKDPMNQLYLKSLEYCDILRPKYFVLENVMGILTHNADKQGNNTLTEWRRKFDDLGYRTEFNVLNSKYFGVPQDRERVFLVGSLEGKKGLIPKESSKVQARFRDIMEEGSTDECYEAETYRTILGCIARNSANNRTPYRWVLVGPDDILPTITCSFDGGATRKKISVIDKKGGATYLRHPTVREGARAQGFPDHWEFSESRTKSWNFIGDAVTSPVAHAIASHLCKLERGQRPPCKKELTAKRLARYVKEMHNDYVLELQIEQMAKGAYYDPGANGSEFFRS